MQRQIYRIDQDEGRQGSVFLQQAVKRFRPGLASQMAESFASAMEFNTVGYVFDLVKGANDDSPVIEKEMWNYENHENFRQGIPFREFRSRFFCRYI